MRGRRARWHWLLGVVVVSLVGMVATSVLAVRAIPPSKFAIRADELPVVIAHAIPPGTRVGAISTKPKAILLAAFADRSTHLGEPVIWWEPEGVFFDAYSGAVWDQQGRVLAGPAPRGLDWYPVSIQQNHVVVLPRNYYTAYL